MRKQLTKTDAEFKMFTDYYKIYQDFYITESNDEYWQGLVKAIEDFCKEHPTPFAEALAVAYMNSREQAYRLKKILSN